MTTLSPADGRSWILLLTSHISTFYRRISWLTSDASGTSTIMGKKIELSPNGVESALHRLPNVSLHKKHRATNLSSIVFLICPEKLTSASIVHVHVLSDFIHCIFFCYCSQSSSSSIAFVGSIFG